MTEPPIISITPSDSSQSGSWAPDVGQELLDFLERSAPEESRASLRSTSTSILSKGISPEGGAETQTGLVVGYVQSGKTMSFEAVTAIARDNGFRIVIVIAGVNNNLLNQSTRRLAEDLGVNDSTRSRRWIQVENPNNSDETVRLLSSALDDWRDPDTPASMQRSVLVTVLKQHQRLSYLTGLLSQLDLEDSPVLIIDDEADQASLNNEVTQDSESTTYTRLMELRSVIPRHTYLQYTATPQAPLLVNIIDSLSPNFVEVLEPGTAYVGGRDFFRENPHLIVDIPQHEVASQNNVLEGPPESLIDALGIFVVGIAAAIQLGQNQGNRSMMVHPSHLTAHHSDFYLWIRDVLENWRSCIYQPSEDSDRLELIDRLRVSHADLRITVGDELPSFDEIERLLRLTINQIQILEVNASRGKTPSVAWQNSFGWILVGGAAMDRGFTIEGLTVSYMPRSVGVGNADTIQQRARFFGYKRSYFGYCRVYLENGTREVFEDYVDHEEDVRSQLMQIQESGQPLDAWKRAFVMSGAMKPCRSSVLDFDYMRVSLSGWNAPQFVLGTTSINSANRLCVEEFISSLNFSDDEGSEERTDIQRHLVARGVQLQQSLSELLVHFRIVGARDSQKNTALLLRLSSVLEENPNETCTVYQMSSGRSRERGVDENGRIGNLFQGAAPVNPPNLRGSIYPGDRAIFNENEITIQIHRLDLTDGQGTIVESDVFILAVRLPDGANDHYVIQEGQ